MTTTDERVSGSDLNVPGAELYYEVTGSGPVLLLIPGGTADADDFARVASPLAERYTVIRYDPRGISRSRLSGPAADVPVAVHAADAQRLLQATGGEPAYVYGSSGGGVIGLALAARHPGSVRALVAHEPPLLSLLPEGSARMKGAQEVYDVYQREGVGPAIQKFIAFTGFGESEAQGKPTPEMQAAMAKRMARMQPNVAFFLAHYMLPVTAYVPEINTLRAGAPRVVVGVGESSAGQLAHVTALALADRLETPAVTFPGGHAGYFSHADAFAAKLHEVLRES